MNLIKAYVYILSAWHLRRRRGTRRRGRDARGVGVQGTEGDAVGNATRKERTGAVNQSATGQRGRAGAEQIGQRSRCGHDISHDGHSVAQSLPADRACNGLATRPGLFGFVQVSPSLGPLAQNHARIHTMQFSGVQLTEA